MNIYKKLRRRPRTIGSIVTAVFITIGLSFPYVLLLQFPVVDSKAAKEIFLLFYTHTFLVAPLVKIFTTNCFKEYLPDADEVMAADPRPPVFYLRSFDSDTDTHDKSGGQDLIYLINPYSILIWLFYQMPSYEQKLSKAATKRGPFVALARPGAPKDFGATRLPLVFDADWKRIVDEQLDRSQLILMRAGETEGLLWEIGQIFNQKLGDKLVIFLCFIGPQDKELYIAKYLKFKSIFESTTGVKLLDVNQGNRKIIQKNRFLTFSKDGEVVYHRNCDEAINKINLRCNTTNLEST